MITRFAPSPTGPLHLGHAFSALTAFDMARAAGGQFLLRIEDLDPQRSRPEWTALIETDLRWLGLRWPTPILAQSTRRAAYRAALEDLWARGLLYRCDCRRRDILAALDAPQEGAPPTGPDGLIYPGTCRSGPRIGPFPEEAVLRLDLARALAACSALGFTETAHAPGWHELDPAQLGATVGDVVLARAGMGASYHLAVVLDDAAQGITHVVRGADLFEASAIHVLLQALFALPTPIYHHHRLIRDDAGKRLAKRDDARALRLYRDEGASPGDIRRMLGLRAP